MTRWKEGNAVPIRITGIVRSVSHDGTRIGIEWPEPLMGQTVHAAHGKSPGGATHASIDSAVDVAEPSMELLKHVVNVAIRDREAVEAAAQTRSSAPPSTQERAKVALDRRIVIVIGDALAEWSRR
jgi:hypothetical protein